MRSVDTGERITLTPPTNAKSQSPARSALIARCTATSDDEHAVSTATLGPCRSSRYDRRLAAMLCALPDAV